ncbi:FMN-dependent NADH-azoreductase [Mycoplasmopsis primatum]|uniref:FMN-dependent NADH-azoreductase n=1 Tax=Mycoplasmopsis primatum TaxID=55604 RepID=UPI000496D97C|nr:FMN-dependent NADH-azoreductase [Mycoplasmopsis primatum]
MQESKKILSIIASPNNPSLSTEANIKITKLLQAKYPNSELTLLDLNNSPFANYSLSSVSKATFYENTESDYWINKLKETDILIISTPMINFNYSATLKNFIDAISVAEKTFTYKYATKGASKGLLDNLKVILIATQGAPKDWYQFGNNLKMLKGTFKFLGVKKVASLFIAGTKVFPRNKLSYDEIFEDVQNEINQLMQKF